MKTRLIALSSALTIAALAALPAHADTSDVTLAWQEPGYVMEVVVVTAKRPKHLATSKQERPVEAVAETAEDTAQTQEVELARLQPGYVEEVVVVTASRSEVLGNARRAIASRWLDARPLY